VALVKVAVVAVELKPPAVARDIPTVAVPLPAAHLVLVALAVSAGMPAVVVEVADGMAVAVVAPTTTAAALMAVVEVVVLLMPEATSR
jgi:hypothetical protein